MNLLKNVVNIVKDAAEEALHTTPLEKALYNSTSNLSVIPAVSDMELIADHTNYYEDSKTIIKYLNKKLKRDNNKRVILRVASSDPDPRPGRLPGQERSHAHRPRDQRREVPAQEPAEHAWLGR